MREMMICMYAFMDNERIHRQGCLSYHCLSNSFVAIYANLTQLICNSVCLAQSRIYDYELYETFQDRDKSIMVLIKDIRQIQFFLRMLALLEKPAYYSK